MIYLISSLVPHDVWLWLCELLRQLISYTEESTFSILTVLDYDGVLRSGKLCIFVSDSASYCRGEDNFRTPVHEV